MLFTGRTKPHTADDEEPYEEARGGSHEQRVLDWALDMCDGGEGSEQQGNGQLVVFDGIFGNVGGDRVHWSKD